jgi:hypothetical protein
VNAETFPQPSVLAKYLDEPASAGGRERRTESGSDAGIGDRYVAMLTLVHATGNQVALPYAMMIKAEFNPSVGITLRFSTDDVTIAGRRLDDLFKAITQHRAREVREAGKNAVFEKEGSGPVVTAIHIHPAS